MKGKRIGLLVFFCIMLTNIASAATIYGTIYDFELNRAESIRVSINTAPGQQIIAVNGRYTFTVPEGAYTIEAEQQSNGQITAEASENITIETEGSYVRDIILFPVIEEEEIDNTTIDDIFNDEQQPSDILIWFAIGATIIVLLVLAYRVNKLLKRISQTINDRIEVKTEPATTEIKQEIDAKKDTQPSQSPVEQVTASKEALPDELQQVIDFLKSQDGRSTQKDIRKQFPQSEAKISLMIADLENRKLVEKIKKGRGNIVILREMKENDISHNPG